MLGHGAGGSVDAPDLLAVRELGLAGGWAVALVEQPYRVAGRRTPPPAPRLDRAWLAVLAALRDGPLDGLALVCGGRSSGARVAVRTAPDAGASAVLCLAFPLQPPARRSGTLPPSRAPELDAVTVPVLVVQGTRDRFGMVEPAPGRTVARIDADHGLKRDGVALRAAVAGWLAGLDPGGRRPGPEPGGPA